MWQLHDDAREGSRVVELADGRILFLPRGRGGPAYEVPDHAAGFALERRVRRVERASVYAAAAVVAGAYYLHGLLLALLGPVLLLPWIVARHAVERLREANDPVARAEVTAVDGEPPGLSRVAVGLGALMAVAWALPLAKQGPHDIVGIAFGAMAVLAAVNEIVRYRRARRERELYHRTTAPENRPVVPR
ncbi:MAG TPA: hypothetical protein VM364_15465 [Vicinamibacterales bacterium]|nr:hypothetical protein [Vicinamibacterales bacterium]